MPTVTAVLEAPATAAAPLAAILSPDSANPRPPELPSGSAIGRYRITCTLGRGGMGTVYEAHDETLKRSVAIKLLSPASGQLPTQVVSEARSLAQLSHPNVVTVYDVGRAEPGLLFIAMELVRGPTLAQWLASGPRSLPEALSLLIQAGRGLAAAHASGIVHRDFKPSNVLVGIDGRVRVVDFGLAQAMEEAASGPPGAIVGTPSYMSPEQLAGLPTSPASDQYSFCATLHEALCGTRPFRGVDVSSLEASIQRGLEPGGPTAGLPGLLPELLARGLDWWPAARHASLDVLLDALEGELRSLTEASRAAGVLHLAPSISLRRVPAPSIAIAPFETSGVAEEESIAAGIAADVSSWLSDVPGLSVVERGSVLHPTPTTFEPRSDGGVAGRYVLGGSIRRAGSRVRITARLTDAWSETCLWSARYDRELNEVFSLANEVARSVSVRLGLRSAKQREPSRGPQTMEEALAWDFFARGRDLVMRQTAESLDAATVLLDRALELAPRFSVAAAWRGYGGLLSYINNWHDPVSRLDLAREGSARSLELGEHEVDVHFVAAMVALWTREIELAAAHAARAIDLSPEHVFMNVMRGLVLHYAGESASALPWFRRAARLDPAHPGAFLHFEAQALFALGDYEAARALEERRLIRDPQSDISRLWLAAAQGHLGQIERARAVWAELHAINPTFSAQTLVERLPYRDARGVGHLIEGLARAGLDPR
jgi:serine/threonine protein kinase